MRTHGTRSVRKRLWKVVRGSESLLEKVDEQLSKGEAVTSEMLAARNQLANTVLRALGDLETIRERPRR